MSKYIPSPYVVGHVSRTVDNSVDSHGNPSVATGAVVARQVQSITQIGRRGSSRAIFSAESATREETTLHLAVDDAALAEHETARVAEGRAQDASRSVGHASGAS